MRAHGSNITTLEGAHRIITADAVDDLSSFILEDWLDAGFREAVWEYGYEPYQDEKLWREMGSVCPVCFALDGQHFKVQWLLESMSHNAPKYSLSHVNCKCRFRRTARQKEVLDFSEEMMIPPSEVPQELRIDIEKPEEPKVVDLKDFSPEESAKMGIPENSCWDKWVWDPARNEFVPYTQASIQDRWMNRRGVLVCR